MLVPLVAAGLLATPATAQEPGISATTSGPDPNPGVPGTSSSFSATFTVTAELGPIQVRISLQGANGEGTLALDAASTSDELTGCVAEPNPGGGDVTCDWDAQSTDDPQTLAVTIAIDAEASWFNQWNLQVVAFLPTGSVTLANQPLVIGPPPGSVTLSGSVVTVDGALPGACIFVLSTRGVFPAIADAEGNWAVAGLPDGIDFAVGVVAPFEGSLGPCQNEGPPPVPPAGALQPEFYDNIWIDLSDPDLVGGQTDPYTYATSRGAASFSATTAGLQTCLTTTPGNVVPRPGCVQQPTSTTSTTTTTTTTQPAGSSTTSPDPGSPGAGIAATGWSGLLGALGAGLLAAGLVLVTAARRRAFRPD
jgi:hypothetical protein